MLGSTLMEKSARGESPQAFDQFQPSFFFPVRLKYLSKRLLKERIYANLLQ